jgi:hypothetical protein
MLAGSRKEGRMGGASEPLDPLELALLLEATEAPAPMPTIQVAMSAALIASLFVDRPPGWVSSSLAPESVAQIVGAAEGGCGANGGRRCRTIRQYAGRVPVGASASSRLGSADRCGG